jgi:hypothetical protein
MGHVMFDLSIISVLQYYKVDRIVFQHTLCYRNDLCNNWDSWFKGYYTAVVNSFQPNTPLYIQFSHLNTTKKIKELQRLYLNEEAFSKQSHEENERKKIILDANELCFEKIIKRSSISDIDETLSIEAIQQFKKTAYQ